MTSTSGTKGNATSGSFFHQERDKLITEIANGMESLLGNVNTLNRKLEESISVGQEFEPIANLWGPFLDMLTASGIPPPNKDPAQWTETEDQDEQSFPPGIAPGGGTIYSSTATGEKTPDSKS